MIKTFNRLERNVTMSNRAVRFHRLSVNGSDPDHRAKRGIIKGFSAHSALRLRDTLHRLTINDSFCFGVTLTCPWSSRDFKGDFYLYKTCFNRFCVNFRRWFRCSGFVFRHEMQFRKVPHSHLMLYVSVCDLPNFDIITDSDLRLKVITRYVQNQISRLWLRALEDTIKEGRLFDFVRYGVLVKSVDDKLSLMRYLSDHTSKHKIEQFGYMGQQWGVCARSNFVDNSMTNIHFANTHYLLMFCRAVRRLSCYRDKKASSPFGSRLLRRRSVRSVSFIDKSTVVRFARYLNKQYLDFCGPRSPDDSLPVVFSACVKTPDHRCVCDSLEDHAVKIDIIDYPDRFVYVPRGTYCNSISKRFTTFHP